MAYDTIYQTLNGFLSSPFGTKENLSALAEYENKYVAFNRANKISIKGYVEMDGVYFIHLKIPSESNPGNFYDVVIEFFTRDESVKNDLSLNRYYIQFFSNSPSFVYKYATLYKLHGYLIESLYGKYDAGMLEVLPEKTNRDLKLSFDKSIYFACRYLQDHALWALSKMSLRIMHKKSPDTFFNNIQDIETVRTNTSISQLEQTIKKEIKMDNNKLDLLKGKIKSTNNIHRIDKKDKIAPKAKVQGKKAISKKAKIAKKSASRTTIKLK